MLKRIGPVASLLLAFLAAGSTFAQGYGQVPASITRIQFAPGTSSYTLTANLVQNASQGYVLGIAAQQSLFITKTGGASVEVLDPQNNVLAGPTNQPGPWGVTAAQAGDYTVVLSGQGAATLSLYVPAADLPQRYSTIVPIDTGVIQFGPGAVGYGFDRDLAQGVPAAYKLGISANQQLNVTTQGNATAAVLDPDENVVPATSLKLGQWQYFAPLTGDYTMVLLGTGRVGIAVYIPPAGSPPPPSVTGQRISFAPGTSSSTVFANLVKGPAPRFILGIASGQTLFVTPTGNAKIEVHDPQGNTVASVANISGTLAFNIPQEGDYTVIVYGAGPVSLTFYIPPLPDWY